MVLTAFCFTIGGLLMFGYRYFEEDRINDLVMKFCDEFSCLFIRKDGDNYLFEEFNRIFPLTEKEIIREIEKIEGCD